VKNELDQQIAAMQLIQKKKSAPTTLLPLSNDETIDDDDDDDDDSDTLNVAHLREDLINSLDACAFSSSNENKCLTNEQVYRLLNNQSDLIQFSKTIEQQLNKPDERMCTSIDLSRIDNSTCALLLAQRSFVSFDIDHHYEVYFESNNRSSVNLLTIDNLLSLCRKQNQLRTLFQLDSTCSHTLPQMIAYFANKTDCTDLLPVDVDRFIVRMQRCHRLYDTGLIRLSGLKRYRSKPIELFDYDSCFRHNFTFLALEYLLDKNFLSTNETQYTAMWFLKPQTIVKPLNGTENHTANSAYDLFLQHFYLNPKFNDDHTKISALNLLNIRISTAMKQIRADMFFVILAISLIIGVSRTFAKRHAFVSFVFV
jgi:hypothetical protein